MELTQLRYFLQVYSTRNICTASAQLNVSQQAVSRQIMKLEEELGVALFVRSSRGVQATDYADLLAQKVQKFLPELDSLVGDFQRQGAEVTGVVRLGIQCWQMSVSHGLRYHVLKDFERAYPHVHLIWENSIPRRCIDGLKKQELDLCVMVMPEAPQDYELEPLRKMRWFMLLSKDHRLASKSVLHIEDLSGQQLILATNEAGTRNRINQLLVGHELPTYVGVDDFIFDLICQRIEGDGAMMLTTQAVQGMFNPERFIMLPLEGGPWRSDMYVARLKDSIPSPAAQALRQFLLEHWGN